MQSSGYVTSPDKLNSSTRQRSLIVDTCIQDWHSPISVAWMLKIRENNFLDTRLRSHLRPIFTIPHDKFETPQAIIWLSEAAADRWSIRIAEKSKVWWEEKVVHLLRGVSTPPQGPVRVGIRRW